MKKFGFLLPGLVIFLVAGCDFNQINFKDVEDVRLQSLVAFPIGETTYRLDELLEEVNTEGADLYADSTNDNVITLLFRDTVNFVTQDDFVQVDDILNTDTLGLPAVPASGTPITIPIPEREFTFVYPATNEEILDSVIYSAGQLRLDVTSNLPFEINYTFTVVNTRDADGNSIVFNGQLNNGQQLAAPTQDLAGYSTSFTQVNGQNQFTVRISGDIVAPTNPGLPASELYFTLGYRNQDFEILFGNFGRDTVNVGQVATDVSFFQELGDGGLTFESPRITMSFINEIGVPAALDLGTIYGSKTDQGTGQTETVFLEGPITRVPQPISAPTVPGERAESDIVITGRNSRLNDIIGISPDQLVFDLTAITNTGSDPQQNFYQDGLELNTAIEILLPFAIQMRELRRDVTFGLPDGFEFDEGDSLAIRIATRNQFPFFAEADLQFLDENDTVVYETTDRLVLATPFLNAQYRAQEPEENRADFPISAEGIEALNTNVERVRLVIYLSTPQTLNSRQIYVELLADYTLQIKASIVAKLNTEL
jgi:hypothetical protein